MSVITSAKYSFRSKIRKHGRAVNLNQRQRGRFSWKAEWHEGEASVASAALVGEAVEEHEKQTATQLVRRQTVRRTSAFSSDIIQDDTFKHPDNRYEWYMILSYSTQPLHFLYKNVLSILRKVLWLITLHCMYELKYNCIQKSKLRIKI